MVYTLESGDLIEEKKNVSKIGGEVDFSHNYEARHSLCCQPSKPVYACTQNRSFNNNVYDPQIFKVSAQ